MKNDPAFACPEGERNYHQSGITTRTYIATKIMAGMAASDYWSQNFDDRKSELLAGATKAAVAAADALIEELQRTS